MGLIEDKAAELTAAFTALKVRVTDDVNNLQGIVADLKTKIDAGAVITAADLAPFDPLLGEMKAFDPDPSNPPVP